MIKDAVDYRILARMEEQGVHKTGCSQRKLAKNNTVYTFQYPDKQHGKQILALKKNNMVQNNLFSYGW